MEIQLHSYFTFFKRKNKLVKQNMKYNKVKFLKKRCESPLFSFYIT